MEKILIRLPWMHVRTYTINSNHHGPGSTTLRRTWQIVRMGSYAKSWTLYVYRGDGRAHYLNVTFPKWRGPWPNECGEREPRP